MMSTFLLKRVMIAAWGLACLTMTAQSQTPLTGKNIATGLEWKGADKNFVETPPPAGPVRSIAEFERSAGALIAFPLRIPMELVIELSKDDTVYTMVGNESEKAKAISEYTAAGVNMVHCKFITAPVDVEACWTRDYSGWFIMYDNNKVGLVDFLFDRSPAVEDDFPQYEAKYLDMELFGMKLVESGGNYMCDGYGRAMQSKMAYTQNQIDLGLTPEQVQERKKQYLGITDLQTYIDANLIAYSNSHIDCWAKLLSPNKIMVLQVPETDPRYRKLKAFVQEIEKLTTPWGTKYEVYRVKTNSKDPFTNSLILNKKVYVPILNNGAISQAALEAYAKAMPGYEIKGIIGDSWSFADALHCRTHQIADKGYLYIKHYPLLGDQKGPDFKIEANVVSCANTAITGVKCFYRVNGAGAFVAADMTASGTAGHYTYAFTNLKENDKVEYYLYADDAGGRKECFPFIGEPDPLRFTAVQIQSISTVEEQDAGLRTWFNGNKSELVVSVRVDKSGQYRSNLYNLSGQSVKTVTKTLVSGTTVYSMDIHDLPQGTYILRIEGNDRTLTTKVLK